MPSANPVAEPARLDLDDELGGGLRLSVGLTFDDVLLVPQYSEVLPSDVSVSTRFSRSIQLGLPIVSAAMDTVTEHALAIALAREGGIGVVHRNNSPVAQAEQVSRVKRTEVTPTGVAALDDHGRLRVAAAVGVGADLDERADLLLEAGVDALVVDTAHGHSRRVIEAVTRLRRRSAERLQIVAGNVATADGARALIDAGVDGIKVGIGPGSICTTRIVAGVGVPQLTAISDCVAVAAAADVPVIADGGVRFSGDLVKALAAGASSVMLGRLLAVAEESPGSGDGSIKEYRAMGSAGAMADGSDRYPQADARKFVPEGVEATVRIAGPLADVVFQLIGGVKAGMAYCGAATIPELWQRASFVRMTAAGQVESHPHDVDISRTAPNYPSR